MKLLLILIYCFFGRINAGYTDFQGNPAPDPCTEGQRYVFNNYLIFDCRAENFELWGCMDKVRKIQHRQDDIENYNNLRTLHCHTERGRVTTTVLGCVTDDGDFINDTKTVVQNDGANFTCTKQKNGFRFRKARKIPIPDQCKDGEQKILNDRFILECNRVPEGYKTFTLAKCMVKSGDVSSAIKVGTSKDEYVDDPLGFRYRCDVKNDNGYVFDPVGCLYGRNYIEPGRTLRADGVSAICSREGDHLRLRPVYYDGYQVGNCTENKEYVEGNYKYKCKVGEPPKAIGCLHFAQPNKIILQNELLNVENYQYKCKEKPDGLSLQKFKCLDEKNQPFANGEQRKLADGSKILCQASDDGSDLERIVVAAPNPEPNQKDCSKETLIHDFVKYKCEKKKFVPVACAPFNNETHLLAFGKTRNGPFYKYYCEKQDNKVKYKAIACFDGKAQELKPEESRKINDLTYRCRKIDDNILQLDIVKDQGCQNPLSANQILQKDQVISVEKTLKKLKYKVLKKCTPINGSFSLENIGCEVANQKIGIKDYVKVGNETCQCIQDVDGLRLIEIPPDALDCKLKGKTYKNDEIFKSASNDTIYKCENGTVVKQGCDVFNKEISAGKVEYQRNQPYFCAKKGDGAVRFDFDSCPLANGTKIKINDYVRKNGIVYVCTFGIRDRGEFVPVLTAAGCESEDKVVPLNGYVDVNGKYVVCSTDSHLKMLPRPATQEEKKCIEETKSIDCSGLKTEIPNLPTDKPTLPTTKPVVLSTVSPTTSLNPKLIVSTSTAASTTSKPLEKKDEGKTQLPEVDDGEECDDDQDDGEECDDSIDETTNQPGSVTSKPQNDGKMNGKPTPGVDESNGGQDDDGADLPSKNKPRGATSKPNQKESGAKPKENSENVEGESSNDGADLPGGKRPKKPVTSKPQGNGNGTKPKSGIEDQEGGKNDDGADLPGNGKKPRKDVTSKPGGDGIGTKPTEQTDVVDGGAENDGADLPSGKKPKKGVTSKPGGTGSQTTPKQGSNVDFGEGQNDGADLPGGRKPKKDVTSKPGNSGNGTEPTECPDGVVEGGGNNDGADLPGSKKPNKSVTSKPQGNGNVTKPTSVVEDLTGGKDDDGANLPADQKTAKGASLQPKVVNTASIPPALTPNKNSTSPKTVTTLKPDRLASLTTKTMPSFSSTRKSVTSKPGTEGKNATIPLETVEDSEGERQNDGSVVPTKITRKSTTSPTKPAPTSKANGKVTKPGKDVTSKPEGSGKGIKPTHESENVEGEGSDDGADLPGGKKSKKNTTPKIDLGNGPATESTVRLATTKLPTTSTVPLLKAENGDNKTIPTQKPKLYSDGPLHLDLDDIQPTIPAVLERVTPQTTMKLNISKTTGKPQPHAPTPAKPVHDFDETSQTSSSIGATNPTKTTVSGKYVNQTTTKVATDTGDSELLIEQSNPTTVAPKVTTLPVNATRTTVVPTTHPAKGNMSKGSTLETRETIVPSSTTKSRKKTAPASTTKPPKIVKDKDSPGKCQDLLSKSICQQLAPLCLPQIPRTKHFALPNSSKRFRCQSLKKQCLTSPSNGDCVTYFSYCLADSFEPDVCQAPKGCQKTKTIQKLAVDELISQLCPKTCNLPVGKCQTGKDLTIPSGLIDCLI